MLQCELIMWNSPFHRGLFLQGCNSCRALWIQRHPGGLVDGCVLQSGGLVLVAPATQHLHVHDVVGSWIEKCKMLDSMLEIRIRCTEVELTTKITQMSQLIQGCSQCEDLNLKFEGFTS